MVLSCVINTEVVSCYYLVGTIRHGGHKSYLGMQTRGTLGRELGLPLFPWQVSADLGRVGFYLFFTLLTILFGRIRGGVGFWQIKAGVGF